MNTPPTNFEPLPARAGSMTAAKIVADLLNNPYPHDLMEIRRAVNTYTSETSAMADLETYCTEEYALKARAGWRASQDAACQWLSSQNDSSAGTANGSDLDDYSTDDLLERLPSNLHLARNANAPEHDRWRIYNSATAEYIAPGHSTARSAMIHLITRHEKERREWNTPNDKDQATRGA